MLLINMEFIQIYYMEISLFSCAGSAACTLAPLLPENGRTKKIYWFSIFRWKFRYVRNEGLTSHNPPSTKIKAETPRLADTVMCTRIVGPKLWNTFPTWALWMNRSRKKVERQNGCETASGGNRAHNSMCACLPIGSTRGSTLPAIAPHRKRV